MLFHEPIGGPAASLTEDNDLTRQIATSATRAQTPEAATAAPETDMGSDRLLSFITASLDQDGAEDILAIPLAGRSPVADFMVIATGRSTRHVAALSENLTDRLKQDAGVSSRVEGKEAADWVLIDTGDVIVHIFRPEVREFYQLEKMWQASPETKPSPA